MNPLKARLKMVQGLPLINQLQLLNRMQEKSPIPITPYEKIRAYNNYLKAKRDKGYEVDPNWTAFSHRPVKFIKVKKVKGGYKKR